MGTWIILIPFQDTGLQRLPIGFLGTCPSFIPLSLLIVVHFYEWLMSIKTPTINRTLLLIVGYTFIVSMFYLLIYGFESHGSSLIFKTFNLSILTTLFLYPVFFIDYNKVPRLATYVKVAFAIVVLGVILNDLIQADFIHHPGIFHAYDTDNWRPRGLSGESSYLSSITATLGLLSAYFSRKKMVRILILVATIVIVIFSASKGGLITLLLVTGMLMLLKSKIRWWSRVALLILLVVAGNYFVDQLTTRFIGDIENTTSTATRSGLIITSLMIVTYNPFGVGFSGFLPAINEYALLALDYLDRLLGLPMNIVELASYIGADTDHAISTKTFLFDNLSYFGIPFLIVYVVFHYKLISRLLKTDKVLLLASVLFCVVAISTYIGGLGMYNISLIYGVAFCGVFRQKSLNSHV
jgi:hypothetical protein